MKLTEAVKALRTRLGELQQAFATTLGISIRGLVNYEKDREPPLALLLQLAAIGREAGDEKLANVFQWAFYEQIERAIHGHQISFLQEDERVGRGSGLLLMTLAEGQFEYASAFVTAMNRMLHSESVEASDKIRKILDELVNTAFPGLRPIAKKKR